MMWLSLCVYFSLLSAWAVLGNAAPASNAADPELTEFPEAVHVEELDDAKALHANNNVIYMSAEKQAEMLDKIAEELHAMRESEATMDDLEAPVIYLTPPMVLPDEQMEADQEVEAILTSTGLEKETEGPVDPFRVGSPASRQNSSQLTSLNDVKAALEECKDQINQLRAKRQDLLRGIRDTTINIAAVQKTNRVYEALNQELVDVENRLEKQTSRLLRLQHVKKALTKVRLAVALLQLTRQQAHGAGHDAEGAEAELEDRESELASAASEENEDNDEL
ncbi:signal peptide containing protein [Babesia caballi]|uniref:Signal peptide containing protein n=1 Tax=Babesia caballi TaxID=5871 RepID=A0AAV4LP79_BABCB|nr:signal peptide containing protein [Babesia caballi]